MAEKIQYRREMDFKNLSFGLLPFAWDLLLFITIFFDINLFVALHQVLPHEKH